MTLLVKLLIFGTSFNVAVLCIWLWLKHSAIKTLKSIDATFAANDEMGKKIDADLIEMTELSNRLDQQTIELKKQSDVLKEQNDMLDTHMQNAVLHRQQQAEKMDRMSKGKSKYRIIN